MIKIKSIIILILTVLFISYALNSQNNKQDKILKSISSSQSWMRSNENNIKVISIFDRNSLDELRSLDQLASIYKNQNITFIAITDNLNDSLHLSCVNELLYYHHLPEKENQKIFNTYQTGMYKVFPIHIIINKKDKIVFKKKGKSNKVQEKLTKRIDKLLDTNQQVDKLQKSEYTIR